MPSSPDQRLSVGKVASHLAVMVVVAAVLGVVTAGLALPFVGALGLGARETAKAVQDLPEELVPEDLDQRTQMVDAKGTVIASLYAENRVNVPLDQISRKMVEAIVAIEDYRFYQHGALDLKGTLRAFITNQSSGGTVQGGSSITQQLVKLTLLNQAKTKAERKAATDDTYERKIRELRYAIAFEEKYSKDWILERYLNTAYFGDGAYGVQAAARHYFGVNAKDLTLPQAALLAGLVKNPTGYDPTNSPDRAFERRNVVLDRMAQLSVISDKRARKAKKSKLDVDAERVYNGCVNSTAPFYCDYVYRYLLKDKDLGDTVKQRKELLRRGGLTIRTTIDLRFQRAADRSVRQHVFPKDRAIGALAMIQPRTGDVKALAQSRPMGPNDKAGETFLNYTVPTEYGDSAGFQGGSTFKAFVLAAAINQGIPLDTSIPSPMQKTFSYADFEMCDGRPYSSYQTNEFENSTGDGGSYDLYSGTQESINTFYIELESRTGLCEPFRLAKKMGVRLDKPNGNAEGIGAEMTPHFALGTPDVSPLEMAEAYATFAGRGLHCDARPVAAIIDSNGETIKEYPNRCQQVMTSSVADAVNDVLRGVMEGDGFGAPLAPDVPSAGKTGTTTDNKAVWFDGYTPALATVAMVAGVDERGVPESLKGKLIGGSYSSAFGSTLAGPLWRDAMGAIDQWLPSTDFKAPPAGEVQGLQRTVPDVAGMSLEDAQAALEQAGFQSMVGGSVDSGYAEGGVVYTSPGAGATFGDGDTVMIYLSTGRQPQQNNNNGGKDKDKDKGKGKGKGKGRGR